MSIDAESIERIAALDEPLRRDLYAWVSGQHEWVGRDAAGAAVGISRALAAFHLDRLAEDGLLVVEYRRLTGRTGPGAGRPAKLYRRAPGTIAVSVPQRDYEAAARLLAEAVERSSGEMPPPAARRTAHDAGKAIGERARREAGPRSSHGGRKRALIGALRDRGYEPRATGATIELGNCPFDALVEEHRPLVCGMNLALAEGMLDGLGDGRFHAELDQQPGRCCVTLSDARPARS